MTDKVKIEGGDYREIPVDEVIISRNFRSAFTKEAMDEMTESVRTYGVRQAITVRPMGGGKEVELIAGERRLRAAKAAGLKTIPCEVIDVDDKTAMELQVVENLHREDLGPVDEARAFKAVLDAGSYTAEALGERLDKSTNYILRSIRLLELPEKAVEAIRDGVLTPAHGHQLLRAPAAQQEEILAYALKTMKIRHFPAWEMRNHVDYLASDLSRAIFPKNKPYAGEIACAVCPFNSGNQGQLFDGAEKGKCCNADCFKKKTGAYMEDYSKEQAAEHPGLQYLGIQTVGYDGEVEGLRRAVVVPAPTKKMIAANPEKFGWCVISPRNTGDKPTSGVVCLDKRLLAPAKENGAQAPGRVGAKRDVTSAREGFIADQVDEAIRQAIRDTVEPRKRFDFTDAQWGIIHNFLTADSPMAVEGVPDRAKAQELLVHAVAGLPDDEQALKDLGINVEKVKAAARKAAEAEWEAKAEKDR